MLRIRTDESAPSLAGSAPSESNPAAVAAARFRRSGYPFLWGVTCEFSGGILSLSGTVPTFYLKQIAQELASHTRGVKQVKNELLVTGSVQGAARSAAAS